MDSFRKGLRLQLIRELPELVEIDTWPEPKPMGNRLRRGMASGRAGLADVGHGDLGTSKFYDRRGHNPEKAASFFATY